MPSSITRFIKDLFTPVEPDPHYGRVFEKPPKRHPTPDILKNIPPPRGDQEDVLKTVKQKGIGDTTKRVVAWLANIRRDLTLLKNTNEEKDQKSGMRKVYNTVEKALRDTAELSRRYSRLDLESLLDFVNYFSRNRLAALPKLMTDVVKERYPSKFDEQNAETQLEWFRKNEVADFVKSVKTSLLSLESTLNEYDVGALSYDNAIKMANREALIAMGEIAAFVARTRSFLSRFTSLSSRVEKPQSASQTRKSAHVFSSEEEAIQYLANITGCTVRVP
jgi:hypothetical protein